MKMNMFPFGPYRSPFRTTNNRIAKFLGLWVILFDRITKWWALKNCMERCEINPYLAFEVGYNRGVTWGLLYSHSTIVFVLVTTMIIAITAWVCWYAYHERKQGNAIIGEMLVISGSLSNIFDRFWYGGVVDFIELSYGKWLWPSFNIADVAIVCGVVIMLYCHIQKEQ